LKPINKGCVERKNTMSDKRDVHDWIQSTSAGMQAIAVVVGVIFAVIQLSQWDTEREDRQREASYERLEQLSQEPLKTAASYLQSVKRDLLLDGEVSLSDFAKNTEPIVSFAVGLRSCIDAGICHRELVVTGFCAQVLVYGNNLRLVLERMPTPDPKSMGKPTPELRQVGLVWVDALRLSATCPDQIDVVKVFKGILEPA